jgi:hypothetical protein
MKFKLLVLATIISFLVTMFPVMVQSQELEVRNAAKCHVALANGKEAISLRIIPNKKLNKLKASILGSYGKALNSLQKSEVIKVYQCVLEDNKFKSPQARLLDKNTPR